MRSRSITLAAMVLALSGSFLAQTAQRDGEWEVKMEMQMPGMPMAVPAMTMTQCVTKEEVDDPQKALPQGRHGEGQDKCTISEYKIDGNKVTWAIKCEGQQPMTGSGEILYTENAFDGVMKMEMGGQAMSMKYSGKRLGDCTK